ncbi:MAG: hypothetical protein R6W78_06645 [Bacteroidales bacterium]
MDELRKIIETQIISNQGRNIFLPDNFRFIKETIKAISEIHELNPESEKILIDYATEKAFEEFCRINQYFSFNSQARNDLRNIYRNLFSIIRTNEKSIETISNDHYQNLRLWLQKTNPFSENTYSNADLNIEPVACAEYRPDLQIKILKLDIKSIMEPVLDVGCGKNGNFVDYLSKLGIEIFGIDRYLFTQKNLISSDWLEYDYGVEKWGTIFSNLGFSNHFRHHNLRVDGEFIEYGKKYMTMLDSLKIGGKFHYAPDLPFIERFLPESQFKMEKHEICEYGFQTTIITRLK